METQTTGTADKNKHARHYAKYGIVHAGALPMDVSDELCNDCPSNDSGTIVNPKYNPKFGAWLEAEGMPVEPYIVWWSW